MLPALSKAELGWFNKVSILSRYCKAPNDLMWLEIDIHKCMLNNVITCINDKVLWSYSSNIVGYCTNH